MMKMYKKSDLSIIDGMLVNRNNEIVFPKTPVIIEANKLETMVQEAAYLHAQPEATPMPTLDGFKRESIKDKKDLMFTVDTPIMDMKTREAMRLMDEIDDMATADTANELIGKFMNLIEFVDSDTFVACDCGDAVMCFDTPTLGSVLELTRADVVEAIANICGLVASDADDDDDVHMRFVEISKDEFDKLFETLDAAFDGDDDKDSEEE